MSQPDICLFQFFLENLLVYHFYKNWQLKNVNEHSYLDFDKIIEVFFFFGLMFFSPLNHRKTIDASGTLLENVGPKYSGFSISYINKNFSTGKG